MGEQLTKQELDMLIDEYKNSNERLKTYHILDPLSEKIVVLTYDPDTKMFYDIDNYIIENVRDYVSVSELYLFMKNKETSWFIRKRMGYIILVYPE